MKKFYLYAWVVFAIGCGSNGNEQTQVADSTANENSGPVIVGPSDSDLPLDKLQLPAGFQMRVYAEGIEDARSMARGEKGTIFIGNRQKDKVWAVRDEDGDGKAEKIWTIAKGLNSPNGVAFRNGSLYVAEINGVLRYRDIENRLDNPPQPEVVSEAYPSDRHHGWKYMAFGPDGQLYIPVGAPCNICNSDKPIYNTITRLNPEGGQPEIFAEGIRNTVGFDWHPKTKELWFTDNGGDNLGALMASAGKFPEEQAQDFTDDNPPCELNRAAQKGMHFGFPFCHAEEIIDPFFGKEGDCEKYTSPVQKLGPHVAPLGMKFYTGRQFPEEYRSQIIIAEHGSWNRTKKNGYRLMLVNPDQTGDANNYKPFITGWLDEESQEVWGRPVDVLVMPDGSMLISDDHAGVVYRLTYGG